MESEEIFDLNSYIPCQLAAVSHSIRRSLACVLEEQFDISLPEWKVLAIVAKNPNLSAVSVAGLAQIDTVAVSRAVTKLLDRNLILRELDTQDRRCSMLKLSSEGVELHNRITPFAAGLQTDLLKDLSDDEKRVLKKAIKSLQVTATHLSDQYLAPPPRYLSHRHPYGGTNGREQHTQPGLVLNYGMNRRVATAR